MGLLDDAKNLADKAVDAIGGDKVKDGIDTATDKVDEATGGASAPVTEKVDEAAAGIVDGMSTN
jgi:hypothetical protein